KAYISSPRDRELVAVQFGRSLSIVQRISMPGQPNRIILNRAQDRLFAALDNADAVAVIGTESDRVLSTFNITAPRNITQDVKFPRGANPNSLALSPDEQTLYVTNGGTNAVAVVAVQSSATGIVTGMIPTGWYPNSVSASSDGKYLYIINGKSVPGPNAGNCRDDVNAPSLWDSDKT